MPEKLFNVFVTTNCKKTRIKVISQDSIEARIKAVPRKGKANKELIEVLADHFDVKKSDINIVKGLRSRNKLILINEDK
ncbi:MAG: hypothetical protein GF329_21230 [Candidatus Lokiarchaeota archaeon]|nr:hypothetical protein [Candidatus Lokiarchaeota archaeon]